MRIIILSFLLCMGFWNNSDAQWVQMDSGMNYSGYYSLANIGNNIFAGIASSQNIGGVFLSTNNGTTWDHISLYNQRVFVLTANGNNLFAGTDMGVYLSVNNGISWTQSLNNQHVYSLAILGNIVYAGTLFNGLFKSTNYGTTWTQTSLNNHNVYSLAISGNNVFAGFGFYGGLGVYKSTNNGISWFQTTLNNVGVNSIEINGNNIFAGTLDSGIYLSTNNGSIWTHTSLNNVSVCTLALYQNYIFAGTWGNGVYISYNNGINWIQRNEGLISLYINDFCLITNYIFEGPGGYGVSRRLLSELISIRPISHEIPSQFQLYQNYPNPFNPTTKIKFAVSSVALTLLSVYDALGREVASLVNEQLQPGTYETEWDATNEPSGVYYYKLVAGDFSETKKMVLVK